MAVAAELQILTITYRMEVIVIVNVIVGSEARALHCHATPKINFCHLKWGILG